YERRPGLTGLLRQATKPGQDPYPGAVALGPTTHQRAVRHAAGRHLLPITHTSSRPGRLTKNIEAPPAVSCPGSPAVRTPPTAGHRPTFGSRPSRPGGPCPCPARGGPRRCAPWGCLGVGAHAADPPGVHPEPVGAHPAPERTRAGLALARQRDPVAAFLALPLSFEGVGQELLTTGGAVEVVLPALGEGEQAHPVLDRELHEGDGLLDLAVQPV